MQMLRPYLSVSPKDENESKLSTAVSKSLLFESVKKSVKLLLALDLGWGRRPYLPSKGKKSVRITAPGDEGAGLHVDGVVAAKVVLVGAAKMTEPLKKALVVRPPPWKFCSPSDPFPPIIIFAL